MKKLSIAQLLYLLYAASYSKEGTITKGSVKEYLPEEIRKNSEELYEALCQKGFIVPANKHRFSIAQEGLKALSESLRNTDYKFTSQKGPKVLNILLYFLKSPTTQELKAEFSEEEIDLSLFEEEIKKLYFEERKRQELRGVVAIRKEDVYEKFTTNRSMTELQFDKYFQELKSSGKVFSVIEKNNELIQWVE